MKAIKKNALQRKRKPQAYSQPAAIHMKRVAFDVDAVEKIVGFVVVDKAHALLVVVIHMYVCFLYIALACIGRTHHIQVNGVSVALTHRSAFGIRCFLYSSFMKILL